jgi:hypothetical protein
LIARGPNLSATSMEHERPCRICTLALGDELADAHSTCKKGEKATWDQGSREGKTEELKEIGDQLKCTTAPHGSRPSFLKCNLWKDSVS